MQLRSLWWWTRSVLRFSRSAVPIAAVCTRCLHRSSWQTVRNWWHHCPVKESKARHPLPIWRNSFTEFSFWRYYLGRYPNYWFLKYVIVVPQNENIWTAIIRFIKAFSILSKDFLAIPLGYLQKCLMNIFCLPYKWAQLYFATSLKANKVIM